MRALVESIGVRAYYRISQNCFVHAVDDVSLSIKKGIVIGIAGESGSGKSTLLRVLAALINYPLTLLGGKVLYNINEKKIDLLSLDEKELRGLRWKIFSIIPQYAMDSLNPVSKIRNIFIETINAHQKIKDFQDPEKLIEDALEKTGLSKRFLRFYPSQLSGGMRQRVVIALATLLKPQIIFCDEPTTGLDLVTQKNIIQLFREIQEKYKNTLVLVSHDMGFHAQITDVINIMYAGKIVESGPTEKLFTQPYHPYTKALINSLPVIGDKSYKEGISGSPPFTLNLLKGCRFSRRCPYSSSICEKEEIPLIELEPEHFVACKKVGV